MKRKLTWRKRHWFDRGEGTSPRYYRNEPVITDVEVQPRLNRFLPLPGWLRQEWYYVIKHGWIDSDQVGIRDVVWPQSAGRVHPAFRDNKE